MSRAVAKVEQKIVITGADNASDAIKRAQKSMQGLQKQTLKTAASSRSAGEAFAEAGDQAAGRAGKLSTALSSLGDFAGRSEGAFRSASEAAGAFDDVLTLLPGPLGLASAAVAGLTTVIYLQAKAAEQAENRLKQAFSGQILSDVRALRDQFDLSAEASVALGNALQDSGKTAADVRSELVNVVAKAEAVGEDGSEAVKRFAASLTSGVTEAQKLTNRLKGLGLAIKQANLEAAAGDSFLASFAGDAGKVADAQLGKLNKRLAEADQRLVDLKNGTAGPLSDWKQSLSFSSKIALNIGRSSKLQAAQAKATAAQNAALEKAKANIAAIRAEMQATDDKRTAIAANLERVAKQEAAIRVEAAETERQEAEAENAREAREKSRQRRAKARQAAAARARLAAQQAAYGVKQATEGLRALVEYQRQDLETENLIAQARASTSRSTQEKIQAEQSLIDINTRRQILEIENSKLDSEDKAARIQAIKQLARAELTERIKAIHRASAAVRKAAAEARAREAAEARADLQKAAQPLFDATSQLGQTANRLSSTGLSQLTQSLQIAGQAAIDLKSNLKNTPEAAKTAAGAVAGIATVAVDAEAARTQKQLEAEKQRQLATATTEAERNRITQEFEAKKAQAVEDAERRKAAILGAMETAKAVAAAASQNYVVAAAHGAAAGLFFATAGGAFGGSSGAAATPAGGGFNQAASTGGSGGNQGSGSGGQTVHINFNSPLATKQSIGKAVQSSLRSLRSTGYAKAKGV